MLRQELRRFIRRNYQMLLAGTDNTPSKEVSYMRLFENYPVDGIILIGTVITAEHRRFFKEARVPVVVVGQYTKYANCIYHDDYGAGKAMGHAVALRSRERIGYIGVTREDKSAGAAREDGFMAGMKAAGREPESVYRRTAKILQRTGYEESVKIIKKKKHDIDIISCATDTIAAGAIQAVKKCLPG